MSSRLGQSRQEEDVKAEDIREAVKRVKPPVVTER